MSKPLWLRDLATAAQGKQTKKHRPLVPKYYLIVSLDASTEPPENAEQLPPHFNGEGGLEEGQEKTAVTNLVSQVNYGIFHTPEQFVSRAKHVLHPMDTTDRVEHVTKLALDFKVSQVKYGIFHTPEQFVSRAKHVLHPMGTTDRVEHVTKLALDFNFPLPWARCQTGKGEKKQKTFTGQVNGCPFGHRRAGAARSSAPTFG